MNSLFHCDLHHHFIVNLHPIVGRQVSTHRCQTGASSALLKTLTRGRRVHVSLALLLKFSVLLCTASMRQIVGGRALGRAKCERGVAL